MVWLAIGCDGWLWAQWEDGYSLFHSETGETHFINELAALLLQHVADGPKGTDWLCRMAAGSCGLPTDSAWRNKVVSLLMSLAQIELVERISPGEQS